MAFIEKKCSVCGKFSWDSESGTYNERHEKKGVSSPCDTNGEVYVDGVLKS